VWVDPKELILNSLPDVPVAKYWIPDVRLLSKDIPEPLPLPPVLGIHCNPDDVDVFTERI